MIPFRINTIDELLIATTEEGIFKELSIPYIEPQER